MSEHWLWLTVPAGVVCLIVLVTMIVRLVKVLSDLEVASVPLAAEQQLELEAAGSMVLHGEGPQFTRAFAKLDYRLENLADSSPVPLRRIWLKSSRSSMSAARLSLRSFELARPGRYRLKVMGLRDAPPPERHSIVVTHDRRRRTIPLVFALAFSAVGLMACLGLSFVIALMNK